MPSVVVEVEMLLREPSFPSPSALGEQQMNQAFPVVQMGMRRMGRCVDSGTVCDGREIAGVRGCVAQVAGDISQFGKEVCREGLCSRCEPYADSLFEGVLEAGEDFGIEVRVVELSSGEGDEFAPLIAQAEHVCEQRFAVGQVAVAVEEEIAESGVEGWIDLGAAEEQESASCSFVEELRGFREWGEAAARAGEHREGAGDLGTDRVDGAQVEAVGLVEQVPAEQAVARKDGLGEGAGFALEIVRDRAEVRRSRGHKLKDHLRFGLGLGGSAEMREHAIAHLGGGLQGEGDGEKLLRLLDGIIGEQLEEALDEQAGLARARGGLDDEGAADV